MNKIKWSSLLSICYFLFISGVFFVSLILFFIHRIWGDVDLSLMIENAHMIKSISPMYFFKEFTLGFMAIIFAIGMCIKYPRTKLFILFFSAIYILYNWNVYTFPKKESLYGKYYTIPKIFPPQKGKSVIYISMESMTTLLTYGAVVKTEENLIPHIEDLKKENISFQGWKSSPIMGATIPSFAASICGITRPVISWKMLYTIFNNKKYGYFPKAVCVPDILKKYGWQTAYIMGANITDERADRLCFSHSFDLCLGKKDLIKMGYSEISADGYHLADSSVLDAAKKIINSFDKNNPFFLGIILSNTHGPFNGHIESFCDKKYHGDMRDAYRCMDKVIYEFINWCKSQSFFSDTVIYLVGDHTLWNKVAENNGFDYNARKIYPSEEIINVIINETTYPHAIDRIIKRSYFQIDWAPTILESSGFSIFPRSLGLGVSLWSDNPTLADKFSPRELEGLQQRSSDDYYKILYGESNLD